MEFPRLVFKDKGKHPRAGGSYSTELAQDEAQHDELLAAGWFATLPEAIEPKAAPAADDDAPPTRDEAIQWLEANNIVFDRRLGDKKLIALVEEKRAGG